MITAHGAVAVAAAAIIYAAPLYSVSVGSGPLAAYNVVPYEVVCYGGRATIDGIDCPNVVGFAACYDAIDSIIECDSFVNGVTDDLKTSTFLISAGLAVVATGLGIGLLLNGIAAIFSSFAVANGIAVFFRLIAAIGGTIALVNISSITSRLTHGDNDGSQQHTEIGPAIVAALAAPLLSLGIDAY